MSESKVHYAQSKVTDENGVKLRTVVAACGEGNIPKEQITWNPQAVTCETCKRGLDLAKPPTVRTVDVKPEKSWEVVPTVFEDTEVEPADPQERGTKREQ